jgi:lipopolysaccharide/colanic/teichoic acid biosynthesis glycosyltransferase
MSAVMSLSTSTVRDAHSGGKYMRRLFSVVVDLSIFALATLLSLFLRENFVLDSEKLLKLVPYMAVTLMAAGVMIPLTGLHRRLWRFSTINDTQRVLLCCGLTVLSATLIMFVVNRLDGVARSMPVLQALLAFVGMMSARVGTRLWYVETSPARPFTRVSETGPQNVLLVGLTSLTHLYVRAVQEFGDGRVSIAAIVDHAQQNDGMRVGRYRVHGSDVKLATLLGQLSTHGVVVDRIVLTTNRLRLPAALQDELGDIAASARIPVVSVADVFGNLGWAGPMSEEDRQQAVSAGGVGALTFRISDEELQSIAWRPYWLVKRAADAMTAAFLLIVLSPLIAIAAAIVLLDVGRPIVFWQERPGAAGRPFRLVKFRTMANAAAPHDGMLSDSERIKSDDKRSSRIGRILRATRLDELPQLWNILVGEMSFIGPRPLLPADQDSGYAARLLVRPGLTGWAQVKGGRSISAADKAALDVWYLQNASFALDVAIIRETIRVVTRGEYVDRDAIRQAWADLRRSGICAPVIASEQPRGVPVAEPAPVAEIVPARLETRDDGKDRAA